MADIFISYKREDKQIAERLSIALEQLGFDVWWDLNLISGQPYRAAIRAVIDQCKAAIVLWSEKSVLSDFVMDEASYAHRLGKLCPARIDGVEIPMGFGQTHTADLVDWDGELTHAGFQNVVSAVEGRVGRKGKLGSAQRSAETEAAAAELEAFKSAQFAGNAQALQAFLKHFPRGLFANFVRGQLESMTADAKAARAEGVGVDTAPRPPAAPTPEWTPPPAHGPPTPPRPPASPPWAMIGIGAAVVLALAAFMFSLRPWEQSAAPVGEAAVEAPARDVDAEIEAVRQEERERAAALLAAREEELRQQGVTEAQAREQAAREQAAREQAAREQAARAVQAASATYDLTQLNPQVRATVERARDAERRANAAAARARSAAQQAEDAARRARAGEAGYQIFDGGDGRRYEGGWANGTYNGYGVLIVSAPHAGAGDRYSGQYNGGARNGVGVYSYAQNANNTGAALRYEGELANSAYSGVGVFHWRDGRRHAGGWGDNSVSGQGVLYFTDGRRYEGDWSNSHYNGHGVLWDAQGRVIQQGVWTNSVLTEALAR